MNGIYIHINPKTIDKNMIIPTETCSESVPDYYNYSIKLNKQYLKNNYILTEEYNNPDAIFINIKDIIKSDRVSLLIELLRNKPSYFSHAHWTTSALRLGVLCEFVIQSNLSNVVHLEGDNVIYTDITSYFNKINGFAFPSVGPWWCTAGIFLLKNADSAKKFFEYYVKLLSKSDEEIIQYTGPFKRYLEMHLLDIIRRHCINIQDNMFTDLPILPTDETNILFDAASYGQYFYGTCPPCSYPAGFTDGSHYVGQVIRNGDIQPFIMDNKPYVHFKDKVIPIANLHVHNKQAIKTIVR